MYAMNFWMPQLMKALSTQYSNTKVGILVMIPYVAALPVMILVSRSSDHALERRYHVAVPEIFGTIALLLLGTVTTAFTFFSIALWCFVAMGIYCLLGPFWSLPNEFLTGFSAAAGIALINSIGNLGGFVGPYVMGAISRRTGSFHAGLVFAGISLFTSAMLILALRKGMAREAACAALVSQ
jgi:MFS transporter, ACS family, tartrate transporter